MMPKSILLVEENDVVRRNTAAFLRSFGYHVYPAYNGEIAIRLIDAISLDIVITSYHLNGDINGIDIIRHYNKVYPGGGSILITVSHTPHIVKLAHSIGALCLGRPYSFDELLPKLESILS
jgi:DNA-binding response OmpR family regulator